MAGPMCTESPAQMELYLLQAARAARKEMPAQAGGGTLDPKLITKIAKLLVAIPKSIKALKSGNAIDASGIALQGAGTATSIGTSRKVQLVGSTFSQVGLTMSQGAKLLKSASKLTPAGASATALLLVGQKAAMAAGLVSNSDIAACRTALVTLGMSTGAALLLGPLGVWGYVSVGIGALDAVMQCKDVSAQKVFGLE